MRKDLVVACIGTLIGYSVAKGEGAIIGFFIGLIIAQRTSG